MMDTSMWYVVPIMMKVEASLNKKLVFIGLDVDDTQYHGAVGARYRQALIDPLMVYMSLADTE